MASKPSHRAARTLAAAVLAAPLFAAPIAPAGERPAQAPSYEQRADAEKSSRTRYRKLELASVIFIIVGGAVVIYWARRRP